MELGNRHTILKKRELHVERTMTEFEVATLAFQKSTLELQKAAISAQYATVWVAGAVGFAQCALIGADLLFMRRAAIARDKALDILMRRAEEDGLALRTLIDRTSK